MEFPGFSAALLVQSSAGSSLSLNVTIFPRLVRRLHTSMLAIANFCPGPVSSGRARSIAALESEKMVQSWPSSFRSSRIFDAWYRA